MYVRLSNGIWQQNARLFIHFLTNRSTSCLFPMMLSSRQEITCHYFPHQSFSSLRSHVSLYVCPPRAFLTPKLLIIMSRPSAVGRFSFFPLLVKVITPPTVHFYPTSFDAVTAHLNSVKMRCFKANGGGVAGSHCCTCDVCLK